MATKQPTSTQPKIYQRMLMRTLACLVILGVLFAAYRWYSNQKGDFNAGGASDTAGLVSAIQRMDDGAQAVVIKPSGEIAGTSSWKAPATDADLVWRPDGRFLFFVSDRKDSTYHVYRWNPDQPDAEPRTSSKRACSYPTFPVDSPVDANDDLLIVSGGTVQQLDPKTQNTPQILPPSTSTISTSTDEDNGGQENLFQAMYGSLGTSFKFAQWCFGKKYIAAIMNREGGEVLIVQGMEPNKEGKIPRPVPIVAGEHVEFEVNPKDGSLVYDAQGFKWPGDPPAQFVKDNKVTTPFRHVLGSITDPEKGSAVIIGAGGDDLNAFGSLAVSPDGSSVVVVVGPYDESTQSIQPKAILTAPLQNGGIRAATPLVQGEVYEPAWSPDGNMVAFAMRANGKRDIYTIHKDGTAQTNLTKGKGSFSFPRFSPQVKAAASP